MTMMMVAMSSEAKRQVPEIGSASGVRGSPKGDAGKMPSLKSHAFEIPGGAGAGCGGGGGSGDNPLVRTREAGTSGLVCKRRGRGRRRKKHRKMGRKRRYRRSVWNTAGNGWSLTTVGGCSPSSAARVYTAPGTRAARGIQTPPQREGHKGKVWSPPSPGSEARAVTARGKGRRPLIP